MSSFGLVVSFFVFLFEFCLSFAKGNGVAHGGAGWRGRIRGRRREEREMKKKRAGFAGCRFPPLFNSACYARLVEH